MQGALCTAPAPCSSNVTLTQRDEAMRRTMTRMTACGLAALVFLASAPPAVAVEARDLVGWWMSIDATYAPMQLAGFTVPSEEVLIVKEDGRAENRFMMFYDPEEDDCRTNRNCRDMPLGAHGRVVLTGDSLSFADKVD